MFKSFLIVLFALSLFSCSSLEELIKGSDQPDTEEVDESNAVDGQEFFKNREGFEVTDNEIESINKNFVPEEYENNEKNQEMIAQADEIPEAITYYEDNDYVMQDPKEAALIKITPKRKMEIKEKITNHKKKMKFKVYFEFDKSEVNKTDLALIEKHAEFMKQHNNFSLRLLGHTDTRGTREYNLALGENRALAIQKILKLYGVTKVNTVSYGEERPLVKGDTEAAWKKNRRVEFIYY